MTTALQVSAQKDLRRLIEQVERLREERKALSADIADKFAEAKGKGFDPATMRKILALREMSQAERDEAEALLTTYMHAVGFDSTPLARAAERPALAEPAHA